MALWLSVCLFSCLRPSLTPGLLSRENLGWLCTA